jgi:hypothetical protein
MKRYSIVFAAILMAVSMTAIAAERQPDTPPLANPAAPSISQSLNNVEDDPLIKMLHEAKLAGDLDAMRSLEAQMPRPKTAVGGEAGGTAVRSSGAIGYPGDPYNNTPAPLKDVEWWSDVLVTTFNPNGLKRNPDIATASDGSLFLVYQDLLGGDEYVQTYKSTDGGATWAAWGFVLAAGVDLREPTIAIGEGVTGDLVLIAYIVDDGVVNPYVEVASADLATLGFTTHAVTGPSASTWAFYRPVIYTDSHSYSGWYAYMTAGAVIGGDITNQNVTTWRATDGITFDTPNFIWGNSDGDTWKDPDGTFGTSGRDPFITCFNDTNDTLYVRRSLDLGANWEAQVPVYTFPLDQIPAHPVDPDIEAAIDGNNVMVAVTKAFSGNDNPGFADSTDNGATWSYLWSMPGYTSQNEFAVALNANEGGGSFHIVWTNDLGEIWATSRPQDDFTTYFSSTHGRVNDTPHGSNAYPVKGITSNWVWGHEAVVWADFRTGGGVYDIYYDDDWFIIVIIIIFNDGFESGNTSNWSATVP